MQRLKQRFVYGLRAVMIIDPCAVAESPANPISRVCEREEGPALCGHTRGRWSSSSPWP